MCDNLDQEKKEYSKKEDNKKKQNVITSMTVKKNN